MVCFDALIMTLFSTVDVLSSLIEMITRRCIISKLQRREGANLMAEMGELGGRTAGVREGGDQSFELLNIPFQRLSFVVKRIRGGFCMFQGSE